MKIAIEGCCHGELDKIYETILHLKRINKIEIDVLFICGDFEAVRNPTDLQCMAVPPKYRSMKTFYKYYSGEKLAPVLTIFIGGNHEASNYLQQLPYGGWVAPNIYYMGYANVIQFGGIRIGGLSGIYKSRDFNIGHFECPPYSESTKRSAYHVRNIDVFRLKQVSNPVDIMLSHDWPRGIYHHGDKEILLRKKPFLRAEIDSDTLGNPVAQELLHHMKPSYWFSAHLHVKFAALINHELGNGQVKTTRFLALDKCLPGRQFLQVLDIPHKNDKLTLELDPEWLAILKSTNHLLSCKPTKQFMPGPGCLERYDFHVTNEEIQAIKRDFDNNFTVPNNFTQTAETYSPSQPDCRVNIPTIEINPQTSLLCTMLDLTNPFALLSGQESQTNIVTSSPCRRYDEDSTYDSDSFSDTFVSSLNTTINSSLNPDEIVIDSDPDEDIESEGVNNICDSTGVSFYLSDELQQDAVGLLKHINQAGLECLPSPSNKKDISKKLQLLPPRSEPIEYSASENKQTSRTTSKPSDAAECSSSSDLVRPESNQGSILNTSLTTNVSLHEHSSSTADSPLELPISNDEPSSTATHLPDTVTSNQYPSHEAHPPLEIVTSNQKPSQIAKPLIDTIINKSEPSSTDKMPQDVITKHCLDDIHHLDSRKKMKRRNISLYTEDFDSVD